ncbi:MAG: hypothetical protein ABMA00_21125 [Gemmatimonas sp.]
MLVRHRADHARLASDVLRMTDAQHLFDASRITYTDLDDDVAHFAPALAVLLSITLMDAERMVRTLPDLVGAFSRVIQIADCTPAHWSRWSSATGVAR